MRYCCGGWLLLWLLSTAATAAEVAIPEALRAWAPWVLHHDRTQACPYFFNAAQQQCQWASELRLEINANRGQFLQEWQLYAEGWLKLPGEAQSWPRAVQVNGAPALVMAHEGQPALWLQAGRHVVQGEFAWTHRPEYLPLPDPVGLVQLHLEGVVRPAERDAQGRLWLRDTARENQAEADRLEARVFRQISDTIPLQMQIWLELDIAGKPREVLLGPVAPPGYVPLALDSPLPVRLEPDQQLRVQARPGRWRILVTFRHAGGAVTQVSRPEAAAPWPEVEVWVFAAQPHLRSVEVSGAPAIDPQQTLLPAAWRQLPAYRLAAGMGLVLAEQQRGDTAQIPAELHLRRELWLDFSGSGYSFRDTWRGSLPEATRLELLPGAKLGRVTLAGQPQLITQLPPEGRPGVELRRGTLNLSAEGRIDTRPEALSALGWNQEVRSLTWQLNLPPGWRLFAALGPDDVLGTWLQRWTMWHWFGVLLVAAGFARLWSWRWGVLALVTLTLTYHESGAPQLAWLWVLLGMALRAVVPPAVTWLRTLVNSYSVLAWLWLLFLVVPFGVQQVRQALYPQLTRPGLFDREALLGGGLLDGLEPAGRELRFAETPSVTATLAPPMAATPAPEAEAPADAPAEKMPEAKPKRSGEGYYAAQPARSWQELPPDAKVQTGYGLPTGGDWQRSAQSLRLGWNGPVQLSERVRLVLLSPQMLWGLYLTQVALVTVLFLALLRALRGSPKRDPEPTPVAAGAAAVAALCIVGLGLAPGDVSASAPPLPDQAPPSAEVLFPPESLRAELRARLLEPPRCLPSCASLARLRLHVQSQALRLDLSLHLLETAAVPLPGAVGRWLPRSVRLGEGTPLLFRREGQLWALLPPGRHDLVLEGELPHQRTVQLPLPLLPQLTEVQAQGWQVEGLRENQQAAPVLELVRDPGADAAQFAALEPSNLPAFVQIERQLHLGLDWRVKTVVRRLSPPGAAVLLRVPLLPGEAVLTEGLQVEQGVARVQLAAQAQILSWESALAVTENLTLTAPVTESWREVWTLDASSLWHVEAEGAPAISDPQHDWVWQPQPEEQLQLRISRPTAVVGAVLTLESAALNVVPGQRATEVTLTLSARSSLGAQHRLGLPANARVREVRINGAQQPIRQEGASLTLPLVPGVQTLAVQWQQPEPLRMNHRTPTLDLGAPAVNATLTLRVPEDRWVVWVRGPLVGPAVLFWGLLVILLLIALGLSRYAVTPLNALHWFLLLVILSALSLAAAFIVVAWLVLLGLRPKIAAWRNSLAFNGAQVGLALLSLIALGTLLAAVKGALLDAPEMHIVGNHSNGHLLQWYQDRVEPGFTQAWVVSLPLWSYRVLSLVWALWLSFALLHWLRWGWQMSSVGGWWRHEPAPRRRYRDRAAVPAAEPTGSDVTHE